MPALNQFLKMTIPPVTVQERVIIKACSFSHMHFDESYFHQESIFMPHELSQAVPKRKAEYFAGRFLGRECLMQLGFYNVEIPVGRDRCPLWPAGVIGSISHTDNYAACVVASKEVHHGIGIDVEKTISDTSIQEIKSSIVNKAEFDLITYADKINHRSTFTAVFSAKESIFKTLYPLVNSYFDFNAARLTAIDERNNKMLFRLEERLSPRFTSGYEMVVHYFCDNGKVFTICNI